MKIRQVAELFVDQQILQPSQLDDVVQEAELNGKTIEHVLVEGGFVDEAGFYRVIARALGTDFVDLSDQEIPGPILRLVPSTLARLHQALPVSLEENTIHIALMDPLDLRTPEDLRFALGRNVQIVVAPARQVNLLLKRHYGDETASLTDLLHQLNQSSQFVALGNLGDPGSTIEAEANATPIIRFVDLILLQAIQNQASDIHFEPFETEFKIRYRVDGALYEVAPPPRHLALPIISRVKVMANLDIAERRLPQDGRIQRNIAGRTVDLRVSTLPTQFGESVVLRVLDRSAVQLDLESLGLPVQIHGFILEIIQSPNGMFIVTGPTGSGKTTTLYSCLRRVNTIDSKLLTAEEPVEYDLEGTIQVPINESIGLTFARTLRAFLRQDPDCIMVGEIRDLETAQISIQAALTGHLVFTTLHTNDAPGTITRLIDMGVEPFLISSTLKAVLGQRLIRTICPNCRTSYRPNDVLLDELALSKGEASQRSFWSGRGCDQCHQTGYKGRKGIFELMNIVDPLRELINQRAPTVTLKERAIELGMVTLRQDGLHSIFAGETTIEEVLRYT